MTISSYSELTIAVGNWIARSDLGSVIPEFVTLFESDANRKIRVRQMMVTQSTTPSSGQFDLPTDYLTWVNVRWNSNPIVDLDYTHPTQFANLYAGEQSGVPRIFTVMGTTSNVGVVKLTPTSDTEILFTYYQKITSISTAESNWLLVAHPDIYLAGTLTEAYAYTKDYDQAGLWKARRDNMFDEINNLDQKTRGPSAVIPIGATP